MTTIVQVTNPVQFVGQSRIVVPLNTPSVAGSSIAVAFVLEPDSPTVAGIENGGPWWRCGSDRVSPRGRTVIWVRHMKAPAALAEIVGQVANNTPVNGSALVLEAQARGFGDAQQLLCDLLVAK
ncbi:MAG TPA: hypothetical protein VK676_14565 [Steroidobacteraceae bacterium]|jgi:hypothetical protein|nr:hypothetical protein [Steroidobacteraceae bacterium]